MCVLKLPPPFPTALSNWKLAFWLGRCANGWGVCCSFMQKFTYAARCLAGQSGFQVALGGGLVRWLFCLHFPSVPPPPRVVVWKQLCICKQFSLPARCLRNYSLKI